MPGTRLHNWLINKFWQVLRFFETVGTICAKRQYNYRYT